MNSEVEVLEARHRTGREMDEEASGLFERGAQSLATGQADEAVRCLREAAAIEPEHAQIRSLLGVSIVRASGDFEEARTLCESAAKKEFFNPDLYLNLAQVYLRVGRRAEALRYLRRGQMIDPGHAPIRKMLADLGRRRMPVLPFLPRRHPVNRALGTARTVVMNGLVGR